MLRRVGAFVGVVFILMSVAPSFGFAQLKFDVNPNIGLYIPHGTPLLEIAGDERGPTLRSKTPVGGPVFTTRVSTRITPHFGVEGSFSFSPAFVAVRRADGPVTDQTQSLFLSSVRTVFRVPAEEIKGLGFHVGSGVGIISRSGDAWTDTPMNPAFAFVMSAGVRAQLSPRSPLAFRLELEDYISWAQFKLASGSRTRGRGYHDLIWSLGLMIPLSARR